MPSALPGPELDASATRRGLVSTLAQTFAGLKTFAAGIALGASLRFADATEQTTAAPSAATIAAAYLTQAAAASTYLPLTGGTLSGALTVGGHLKPSADIQYDLGATDRRWRYIFTDGYKDGNNVIRVYTPANNFNRYVGTPANGASAIAHEFDSTSLTTSGAKLASWKNNGVEKAFIDKDGGGYFDASSGIGIGITPLYKFHVGGAPKNTVMFGINGTQMVSGDIGFYFAGPTLTGSLEVGNFAAPINGNFSYLLNNQNSTSGNAHAFFEMRTTGASGGDPKMMFTVSGVLNWTCGIDNSDSDKFKISASHNLGAAPGVAIDTSGNVTPDGDVELAANKGVILRSPNGTRYRITVANDGTLSTTVV